MDLIQPVSRLSWPILEDLLSDSEGVFQISCQSLSYPFPFFRKVKERKKKDPFYTKTRLTRYLCNLIYQNCTNKSQKWLHEIIQLLKIFKILAVSLCQRWQKRTRFEAIWHEFSNPQFSDPRPPSGRPRDRTIHFSGGSAAKKGSVFSVFHFWDLFYGNPTRSFKCSKAQFFFHSFIPISMLTIVPESKFSLFP